MDAPGRILIYSLQTSVNRKPNSRTRRIGHFVDSRSEAGGFERAGWDRVSSGLCRPFGEVACAASSPRWRRSRAATSPQNRPAGRRRVLHRPRTAPGCCGAASATHYAPATFRPRPSHRAIAVPARPHLPFGPLERSGRCPEPVPRGSPFTSVRRRRRRDIERVVQRVDQFRVRVAFGQLDQRRRPGPRDRVVCGRGRNPTVRTVIDIKSSTWSG